jgi:hypothetical protein
MSDGRELEKLLGRFSRKPAPPGLREKVLRAAEREASARRVLTPAWRWALASSLVLMAVIMLSDWRLSSGEQNRLSALTIGPGARAVSPKRDADEKVAEVLACLPDLDAASRLALRQAALNEGRTATRSRHSAQTFLEGISEY